MAKKIFFDLLKEKMAALRPSARHREEDWIALTTQLDQAMPQRASERRQAWAPLLLLLLALLSSNALWWNESQENRIAMRRVEMQLAGLQISFASFKSSPPVVHTDTVWRRVYVQAPDQERIVPYKSTRPNEAAANNTLSFDRGNDVNIKNAFQQSVANNFSLQQKNTGIGSVQNKSDLPGGTVQQQEHSDLEQGITAKIVSLNLLEAPEPAFLKTTIQRTPFNSDSMLISDLKPYKPTRPFGSLVLNALKPKYVKVGAIAGWLHPLSPALIHQVGYEVGAQGAIGFSRNWSLTLEYAYGELHYESNKPEAILGSPEFPALPSSDHLYAHLNLQRQTLRQFGLGLRYTFSEWGKTHPFIGLSWCNQTLLPYKVEYEIQHEPSGTIQPDVLSVDKATRLRNIFRLTAGLEVQISRRLDLSIGGFYLRQWKKKNKDTLDQVGLRIGANWTF